MSQLYPGDGALLVMAPLHVREVVTPWRRIYDPHEQTIPPHITVAYPPFVRGEAWASTRAAVGQTLSEFSAFEVALAAVGGFESPQAVMWLRPDDGGMLVRLYTALSSAFPAYMTGLTWPYIPHLTLGFFDAAEALAEARARVTAVWQPQRFRVESLSYVTYGENGVWQVCDELPLGQQQG